MLIGSGPRFFPPAGDGERDAFGDGELLCFATGGDLRGVRRVEVATIFSLFSAGRRFLADTETLAIRT